MTKKLDTLLVELFDFRMRLDEITSFEEVEAPANRLAQFIREHLERAGEPKNALRCLQSALAQYRARRVSRKALKRLMEALHKGLDAVQPKADAILLLELDGILSQDKLARKNQAQDTNRQTRMAA